VSSGATAERAPETADALVGVLVANGVDSLFVMPGDAFPVLEAIARREAAGAACPRVVTCLHEVVALAAAHGHFMVSGRPQACLFHVDVGLQMAGGMLHNAQRGRAGVVIFSGRTPMTVDGSLRGGRVVDVHWMQDRLDLAGVVRGYVKWSYDLSRAEILPHVVQRAFQVAASDPAGPVYVSLLRELLLEPAAAVEPLAPERYRPPAPGVPASESLERVADLIVAAERPVALAGYVGRSAAGFHALTAFADAAAVPVIVRPDRANMSSDSPMYAGPDGGSLLADADLVLLLDVDVPYVPAFQRLRPGATVVQIDIDPLKPEIPLWGFPVDVALAGNTAAALRLLRELVEERRTPRQEDRLRRRHAELALSNGRQRDEWRAAAAAAATETPIAVEYLSSRVADIVDDETIVVDDSTTARAVVARYLPTRVPGSYFGPSGSSMGWGSGAAIGAKLAAPEKTVINLNAEGNFVSGVPEAALWSARRAGAPVLTVVYDNAQYAAIRYGMLHEYGEGAAAQAGFRDLDLSPTPDLVRIAEACGAYGERVTEPAEIGPALRRALDAVAGGDSAVLDVVVAAP